MEIKARSPTISSHKMLQLFARARGNASDGPIKVCLIREGFIFFTLNWHHPWKKKKKKSFKVNLFISLDKSLLAMHSSVQQFDRQQLQT